jgi:hypothetical protein
LFRTLSGASAALATAGLLAFTPIAAADSADNDGVNVGNDNNVSLIPVQLCGNNVAVLGAVVPLLSPQVNECVNAPIVDHPKPPEAISVTPPAQPGKPSEHPGKPVRVSKPGAKLPLAPAAVPVAGHHAVTG